MAHSYLGSPTGIFANGQLRAGAPLRLSSRPSLQHRRRHPAHWLVLVSDLRGEGSVLTGSTAPSEYEPGAERGIRTPMPLRAAVFETAASAASAISAPDRPYHHPVRLPRGAARPPRGALGARSAAHRGPGPAHPQPSELFADLLCGTKPELQGRACQLIPVSLGTSTPPSGPGRSSRLRSRSGGAR